LCTTKFCLGLQIEHLQTGILVHQSTYVKKVLKKSIWTKHTLKGRALEKDKDTFRPKQEGEEVLGAEYPYLSIIGALIYLSNNTRSDIAFVVNCLAKHNVAPTMHHWNGIKNVLQYLNGTIDLDFF
jgi:hypothetical protein